MKKIAIVFFVIVLPAAAHHGYKECRHSYDCLAAAEKMLDAGDIKEARNYMRPAMERSCPVIYDANTMLDVSPDVQVGAIAQKECSVAFRQYCRLIRAERGDWAALSCLYGRGWGPDFDANLRPDAEKILAERGMTFSEYLDRDRIDWAREIQKPLIRDVYGIK